MAAAQAPPPQAPRGSCDRRRPGLPAGVAIRPARDGRARERHGEGSFETSAGSTKLSPLGTFSFFLRPGAEISSIGELAYSVAFDLPTRMSCITLEHAHTDVPRCRREPGARPAM